MTFNEYQITSYGYFLRHDRAQEGFRKLYVLHYNTNAKKGKELTSADSIRRHWPLLTDPKLSDMLSRDEIKNRLKRATALTAAQKVMNVHN